MHTQNKRKYYCLLTFASLLLLLDMLLNVFQFQLFAASFPLAPLMAILLNLIDIRIDAKRMLWSNRRPIAYIRQDIGLSLNLYRNFILHFKPPLTRCRMKLVHQWIKPIYLNNGKVAVNTFLCNQNKEGMWYWIWLLIYNFLFTF